MIIAPLQHYREQEGYSYTFTFIQYMEYILKNLERNECLSSNSNLMYKTHVTANINCKEKEKLYTLTLELSLLSCIPKYVR